VIFAAAGFAEQNFSVLDALMLLGAWSLVGYLAGLTLQTLAEIVVFRAQLSLKQLFAYLLGVGTVTALCLIIYGQ
jgi:hypothetical protein